MHPVHRSGSGAMAAVIVTIVVAACSNDDDGGTSADGTMPVLQTTTIVTTATVPVTTQPRFYEVQSGDTLTKIAASFGLPAEAIMQANAITDPNRIFAGQILILPLIGIIFVVEAGSVMLQVAYFKLTHGKRIFRMSPLHHHFELGGWDEEKITLRFWIVGALAAMVGVVFFLATVDRLR